MRVTRIQLANIIEDYLYGRDIEEVALDLREASDYLYAQSARARRENSDEEDERAYEEEQDGTASWWWKERSSTPHSAQE